MQKHNLIDIFTDTNGEERKVFLTSFNRAHVLQRTPQTFCFMDFHNAPLTARNGDIIITKEGSGDLKVLGCAEGRFTTDLYGGLHASSLIGEARLTLTDLSRLKV